MIFALALTIAAVFPRAGAAQPPAGEYLIGPQDVLLITVFDQANLGGKYPVELDGSFTFPLIGRITAGGLTVRQFESELKGRLADGFFRNPQLTVSVEHYRSQRVFVIGEVRAPGTYPLTGEMTLIEALARAGSTTAAAADEVVVVRTGGAKGPLLPAEAGGTADVVRINLKDLQSGAGARNVALHDGDTIFVARAEEAYVFGEVKNPGSYAIRTDTTVLQALSLAGGVTPNGAIGRVKIVRERHGKKTEAAAKLTDLVRPGDTIIVPERYF